MCVRVCFRYDEPFKYTSPTHNVVQRHQDMFFVSFFSLHLPGFCRVDWRCTQYSFQLINDIFLFRWWVSTLTDEISRFHNNFLFSEVIKLQRKVKVSKLWYDLEKLSSFCQSFPEVIRHFNIKHKFPVFTHSNISHRPFVEAWKALKIIVRRCPVKLNFLCPNYFNNNLLNLIFCCLFFPVHPYTTKNHPFLPARNYCTHQTSKKSSEIIISYLCAHTLINVKVLPD